MLVVLMVIIMMTLVEFLDDFSRNHLVQDLDSYVDGVVVAPITDTEFLIRVGSVSDGSSD